MNNNRAWELAQVAFGKSYRIGMAGPPGTGKTKAPHLFGERNGYETISYTFTNETQPSELIGSYGIQGGDFVWLDGVIATAWRKSASQPVIVVLDEIDHCGGAAMSTLQGILNDPDIARMDLPTGEVLKPTAGQLFYVATMNGEPDELPPAIRDRFPVMLVMETPNPEAIACLDPDLRDVAFNSCTLSDENRRLSVRPWFAFMELRQKFYQANNLSTEQAEALAAELVFGNRSLELVDALKLARKDSGGN